MMNPKRTFRSRGFTLAELIIGMTILGLIMAAMAGAMSAALTSHEANISASDLHQTARLVLNRLAREVRSAANVVKEDTQHLGIYMPTGSADPQEMHYFIQNGSLIYRTVCSGTTTDYTVIDATQDNVTVQDFQITITSKTLMEDADGDSGTPDVAVDYPLITTVTLNMVEGSMPLQVTASAALRQNYWYIRQASE